LAIVLSVLLRFTDSDYLPLVSSNSSYGKTKEDIPTIYHCKHDIDSQFGNVEGLWQGILATEVCHHLNGKYL
jgi:hypothetical protein